MSFPDNLGRHRMALLEMLEEAFRDTSKRSALKTRGISMLPFIREKDEVVIQAIPREEVRVGDVIAYRAAEVLLVHRVVAIQAQGDRRVYYEKGDNNMYLTAVLPEQILGVVVELRTGGRSIPLGSVPQRRLAVWAARYGLRAVRLFHLLAMLGARVARPGGWPSRQARRIVYGLLQVPLRLVLGWARHRA